MTPSGALAVPRAYTQGKYIHCDVVLKLHILLFIVSLSDTVLTTMLSSYMTVNYFIAFVEHEYLRLCN